MFCSVLYIWKAFDSVCTTLMPNQNLCTTGLKKLYAVASVITDRYTHRRLYRNPRTSLHHTIDTIYSYTCNIKVVRDLGHKYQTFV